MAYEFHYTPTGTGVISGKEVLEQTEDAINDLGNTAISGVQEALDKAEQALTNSANAVDDAQTALNTANNAEGVAIQAQTDVGNLSGTVANIGNRVTTAEGNISNLQGRMTTAEGNITNIQGRMTTAETNIGNLQTAVSTAQATANSAQQTATTARQQSYVLRYSSSSVTDNSTIAYSTLDNTDNVKTGDKVIDVDGKIFSVVSVDTTNQTVTVGTALIDLALDANVVHTSGDETVGGEKTFTSSIKGYNSDSTQSTVSIDLRTSKVSRGNTSDGVDTFGFGFRDKNNSALASISCVKRSTGGISEYHTVNTTDSSNNVLSESYSFNLSKDGNSTFRPETNDKTLLGTSTNNWKGVYATNYYYGSDNVEFSTKFVTTDTNQTISGSKTLENDLILKGSTTPVIVTKSKIDLDTSGGNENISWTVKDKTEAYNVFEQRIGKISSQVVDYRLYVTARYNNSSYTRGVFLRVDPVSQFSSFNPSGNNLVSLGQDISKYSNVYTNKVNNLEPSSLSLPNVNTSSFVDISGYFTNTGTGEFNTYPVTANGWIFLRLSTISSCQVSVLDSNSNMLYGTTSSGGIEQILVPVIAGTTFQTQWATASTVVINKASFIPCQGNV